MQAQKIKFTKRHKRGLDEFISYAVKEGALDAEKAEKMSYEDKEDYFDWSDYMANQKESEIL